LDSEDREDHVTRHPLQERHYGGRIGWLRAAVLGANDGIVSTASLIVGVAAADPGRAPMLLAGVAGLVAGAMSMAAGEYVSVSSQADTEASDLERERGELASDPAAETAELAGIYEQRGLSPALARQVADELMEHDALGAHLRDELGLTEIHRARPLQAAFASAATFSVGAGLPLFVAWITPLRVVIPWVSGSSLVFLAILGALAARVGGARIVRGTVRVVFWGAFAMALTALVGRLVGVAV
jgi:VIT1/CCC1 family predicted Fe2+/Mn2+ transporter